VQNRKNNRLKHGPESNLRRPRAAAWPKGKKQKISVEQLAGHLEKIKVSDAGLREVIYEDERL